MLIVIIMSIHYCGWLSFGMSKTLWWLVQAIWVIGLRLTFSISSLEVWNSSLPAFFFKNFVIKTFVPLKVGKVEQQTSIYPSSRFLAFLLHLVFGGSILKPNPDIITFPSQIFPTASLKNKDTSCIISRPLSQLTNPIVMPQYHLMLKPYSYFPQLFLKVFPVESGCKKTSVSTLPLTSRYLSLGLCYLGVVVSGDLQGVGDR